jgi:hypothetical protein
MAFACSQDVSFIRGRTVQLPLFFTMIEGSSPSSTQPLGSGDLPEYDPQRLSARTRRTLKHFAGTISPRSAMSTLTSPVDAFTIALDSAVAGTATPRAAPALKASPRPQMIVRCMVAFTYTPRTPNVPLTGAPRLTTANAAIRGESSRRARHVRPGGSRSGYARNPSYVDAMPSRKPMAGSQPRDFMRVTSRSLRGVPSGLEVSHSSSPE